MASFTGMDPTTLPEILHLAAILMFAVAWTLGLSASILGLAALGIRTGLVSMPPSAR